MINIYNYYGVDLLQPLGDARVREPEVLESREWVWGEGGGGEQRERGGGGGEGAGEVRVSV